MPATIWKTHIMFYITLQDHYKKKDDYNSANRISFRLVISMMVLVLYANCLTDIFVTYSLRA